MVGIRVDRQGPQVLAPSNRVTTASPACSASRRQGTASALVNVFTAGNRVMPMFAVQGCDYGLQTLADPANDHTVPVVPTLAFDTDSEHDRAHAAQPGAEELDRQRGGSLTLTRPATR